MQTHHQGQVVFLRQPNQELYEGCCTGRIDTRDWLIGELAKVPIEYQPADKYTYGMSTAVLGRAIEALSGRTLDQFLRK